MRYRTPIAFLALGAIWGTSFPAVRAGVRVIPPVLFAALRFDATAVVLLAFVIGSGARWRPRREEWRGIVVGAATFVALHHALLFAGQQYVTSAVAAVVVATIPILTAGLSSAALPEERLAPLGVVGLGFGFLGTVVVADPSPSALRTTDAVGVSLVFASALAFAVGAVAVERTRTDLPVAALQGWMMAVGAPLLHAASLVLDEPQSIEWTPAAVAAFGYLVPVAGVLGYLLYFDLLDRVGSVELNLVSYVVPIVAALTGWIALNESLALETALGFVLVASGFVLVKRRAVASLLA
ncbi:DMT family transporter [Natronococcus wangiae]|uniref:DMT family transporter n=1 Tax=Natronococcus wangiae TaxID=3068275 RepID=UPI00273FDA4D|nr:DMT family transporter [Natronococcus sp. AD5]